MPQCPLLAAEVMCYPFTAEVLCLPFLPRAFRCDPCLCPFPDPHQATFLGPPNTSTSTCCGIPFPQFPPEITPTPQQCHLQPRPTLS